MLLAKACELARAAIETPESAISALPEDQARDRWGTGSADT